MQAEEVVEIAADRFGGAAARGDVGLRRDHRGRRQQLELQVVRQLQLAPHPLLAQVLLDEPRVLDRGADLIGDGGDQFAVTRREGVFALPIRQIDHADGRGHAAR